VSELFIQLLFSIDLSIRRLRNAERRMTARNLDQYGDGLFDILWKGALQPIIDDFNNSDDEKQESKISNISSESPTSTSKHCVSLLSL